MYGIWQQEPLRPQTGDAKPQMTTYAVWNLMRNNVFDSSKASRELGYTTRPYRETMHDQIHWLKSEGLI